MVPADMYAGLIPNHRRLLPRLILLSPDWASNNIVHAQIPTLRHAANQSSPDIATQPPKTRGNGEVKRQTDVRYRDLEHSLDPNRNQ